MTTAQAKPVNQKIRFWIARLAMLAVLPVLAMARPVWLDNPLVLGQLRAWGTIIVILGVLYRFWAILYIGGRKNQTVVQDGPYSLSRHPLYFGTTVAAVGLGLMLGSFVLAALLGLVSLAILTATAAGEERFLRAEFGADYEAFALRVPNRILPQPRLFTTPPEVTFNTRILRTNFGDALGFLVLIPVLALIEALKHWGVLGSFAVF